MLKYSETLYYGMRGRQMRMEALVAAIATKGEDGGTVDAARKWFMETFSGIGLQAADISLKEARILEYVRVEDGQVFITERGRARVAHLLKPAAGKRSTPARA